MKNVATNNNLKDMLIENMILKCKIAHANHYSMTVEGFDYWHGEVEKAEFTEDGLFQIEYTFGDVFAYELRNDDLYTLIHVHDKEREF